MLSVKEQIKDLIDYVPESEQVVLLEVVKHFVADDIATPDDLAAIEEARREFENGETIPHEAIDWD